MMSEGIDAHYDEHLSAIGLIQRIARGYMGRNEFAKQQLVRERGRLKDKAKQSKLLKKNGEVNKSLHKDSKLDNAIKSFFAPATEEEAVSLEDSLDKNKQIINNSSSNKNGIKDEANSFQLDQIKNEIDKLQISADKEPLVVKNASVSLTATSNSPATTNKVNEKVVNNVSKTITNTSNSTKPSAFPTVADLLRLAGPNGGNDVVPTSSSGVRDVALTKALPPKAVKVQQKPIKPVESDDVPINSGYAAAANLRAPNRGPHTVPSSSSRPPPLPSEPPLEPEPPLSKEELRQNQQLIQQLLMQRVERPVPSPRLLQQQQVVPAPTKTDVISKTYVQKFIQTKPTKRQLVIAK